MRLNWPMLVWGGHRLLAGKPRDLRTLAHTQTELAPAEALDVAPAIYPTGALDHITDLSPWRTWDRELELINGGAENHAATIAYQIDDVLLSGAFLYKKAGKAQPGHGDARLWGDSTPTTRIDQAHLVSCFAGSRFFGPFLKDSLPLELLPPAGSHAITMQTKPYGDEPGYRAIFDLPAPPLIARARIKHLTFYDDFGQNSAKAARYAVMRDRLRRRMTPPDHTPPIGIYLKRGATGEARIMANEAALEDRLTALGFDIVTPSELTAQDTTRRILGAPIVISVEGSHMSHAVYSMADKAALVVLQPPDRFAMAFKEFTDRIDIRFGFVVGRPAPDGFSVDISELEQLIDRLS